MESLLRRTRIRIRVIFIALGTFSIIMSFRGSFGLGIKPVEMGKEYGMEVTELSERGDAVAEVQGFVTFVRGAETGQKARLRITNIEEHFAKAELV